VDQSAQVHYAGWKRSSNEVAHPPTKKCNLNPFHCPVDPSTSLENKDYCGKEKYHLDDQFSKLSFHENEEKETQEDFVEKRESKCGIAVKKKRIQLIQDKDEEMIDEEVRQCLLQSSAAAECMTVEDERDCLNPVAQWLEQHQTRGFTPIPDDWESK